MKRFTFKRMTLSLVTVLMALTSQNVLAQYVPLTFLDGSKNDNSGESSLMLIDGKRSTKWGQEFNPSDPELNQYYIIFKADEAVTPVNYFLCTGGDTGTYPQRNWSDWTISGANFASDEEATLDAEGWVVIDERASAPLSTQSNTLQDFKFNSNVGGKSYKYFKIIVTDAAGYSEEGQIYMQMSEFGLCTSEEFVEYLQASTGNDEPVIYNILDGTRNDGSDEGLDKLFDSNSSTKWGNGFTNRNEGETTNGAFFIIKASRAMAPTYYSLTTANDTKSYPGRNWKQWQIYGMNANNDREVTRTSDKWVAIDKKYDVGTDQLPAENYTQVFFSLSEENATEYLYFKVEIDQIMTNGEYMQMADFLLGDQYTFQLDKDVLVNSANEVYNPDLFAEKALLDQMADLIATVKAATSPSQLGDLNAQVANLKTLLYASSGGYSELLTAQNTANNLIAEDNLNDEALAYIQQWLSESPIAPSNEFPVGNLAYIKANRQLTGDEAKAEGNRVTAYLLGSMKRVDDPIEVTYETIIDGPGFNDGEMAHSLVDGDRDNTKWCVHQDNKPWVFAFKSSEPIKPTYYGLVTGGDTSSYPDRNWTSWKIWAADFDSDEDVTIDSEAWVLIDEKYNVGTDVLKTTSLYESYINLSNAPSKPYQYFKILVEACGGDRMQMNEFTFYNQGNLVDYREQFVEQVNDSVALASDLAGFSDITEDMVAYKPLIDEYLSAYSSLKTAISAPSLTIYRNRLLELITEIRVSYENYAQYTDAVSSIDASTFSAYPQASTWAEGYFGDAIVEPGVQYVNGSSQYILQNRQLDNDGINAELKYITTMEAAAIDPDESGYIVLGGHTVSEWGDGHYSQIVDYSKDAEGKFNTKWGGVASEDGDTYVIFRTIDAVNPYFYTLTTGGDTYSYQGRNWKTWEIYGANFDGDGAATKDADGWVLVDRKENIGQDRLHPENLTASYFSFSTETTEKYLYYKVVVYAAYSGNSIQMQELRFGTEQEFDAIKDEYTTSANDFDTDVIAEKKLLDEYQETVPQINEAPNMEALFRVNYAIEQLQQSITASVKAYSLYDNDVEAVKAYLEENPLEETEALATLKAYIEDNVEPNETFANGSASYVLENHVLPDSVVTEEADFLESLKMAAVATGYVAGTDISSMIVNRSFAKAGSTLKDEDGNNIGRVAEGWDGYIYRRASDDEGHSAAEFCNENAKFNISQTLTDMKNGYYTVTLNAAFRANGSRKSYNYNALAYANGVQTYVPVIIEGKVAEDEAWLTGSYQDNVLYNCDLEEPTGNPEVDSVKVAYVVWSPEGMSHAIGQGRYAITMVTKVTDGKLTIGVKNNGTLVGGDWLGVGNFGLTYLGEEASAEAIAAAAAYNGERAATINELYIAADATDTEEFKAAPSFGAAQLEALSAVATSSTVEQLVADGKLFEQINATKAAYYTLSFYKDVVLEKWINHPAEELDADIYGIVDKLNGGEYSDAEAAEKALDELLAKYPDYLEFDESKNVDYEEGDTYETAFDYKVEADGRSPYIYLKSFYDALTEDEVLLTFDYKAAEAVEGGVLYFGTPNIDANQQIAVPTLEPADEWTTVTIDITKAVKEWGFGQTDHQIRWDIVSGRAEGLVLNVRHFLISKKAGATGDLTGDGEINAADIQALLNIIAAGEDTPAADLTGDGEVNAADIQALLNIIAAQ